MDIIEYIWRNLSHIEKMSDELIKELNNAQEVGNYLHLINKIPLSEHNNEKFIEAFNVNYEMIENYYLGKVFDLMIEHSKLILEKHPDIYINKCPICNTIARTPVAKQAPCGHSWR